MLSDYRLDLELIKTWLSLIFGAKYLTVAYNRYESIESAHRS